ncbi:MAG: TlpA family protein disulfide reductase, partial [Duncaniella sp.]|uniref:TlpA family protein disulfide reductase n=1 Tax=Duncaniella sp. TaxID=2518496 RepID=UPI0023BF2E30
TDQIKNILLSYTTDADSIIALRAIPAPEADFIRLQAYIAASDAYRLAAYMASRSNNNSLISFGSADILPAAASVLDTPMAASFPTAPQIILGNLPKGTLEERLAALDSSYKTAEIKNRVKELLVSAFLDSFDYANDFESGESRLKAVIEQYSLPETYLAAFRGRRATIAGTPFPASVNLVDRDGNKVDFSSFRGKYVYVDLWASWCGPCCKEVPYLQQLEKDFENSDVVFVSISIDSTKAPWLKKMDQLNMHGNQLWNSDGELPKLLNIRGIPHFIIYDREGKLLNYDAPRPSSEQTRTLLQSLK